MNSDVRSESTPRKFASVARLAIVIPIHNGWKYTRFCLESLRRLAGPQFMVIVVDDGSTDGSAERLAAEAPDVIVVEGSGNLWWSGGVNAGCDRAIELGAQRLILLNNDNILLSSNLLIDLDQTIDNGATCACSVSAFIDRDGMPRICQRGTDLNWRDRGLTLVDFGEPWVDGPRSEDKTTISQWLPGMALAFDSSTYIRMNGFDAKRFPQYRGDADFTLRVSRAGGTCVTTHRSWLVNDLSQNGINYLSRMTFRRFLAGLTTRRSNFELRSVIGFAVRHCPRRLVVWHLGQFYARYIFVSLRSQFTAPPVLPLDSSRQPLPDRFTSEGIRSSREYEESVVRPGGG